MDWINLGAIWRIVVVGLIAGAGLPAVFAIGLRSLALRPSGQGELPPDSTSVVGGNPLGMAVAAVCFAVVLAGIGWGIYFIVAGT